MIKRFNEMFSAMQLKHKVRFLFLVVLTIYLVALFLIYTFVLRKQIYSYALENNKKSLLTIGSSLTAEVEKVNNYSRLLITNPGIRGFLHKESIDDLNVYNNAIYSIYGIQDAYPEASSVFIFRNDGKYLTVGKGVTYIDEMLFNSEEWMKEIKEKDGGYVLRLNGDGVFRTLYDEEVISLIRNINDMDSLQKEGTLAVNFPLSVIENTYQDFLGNGKHFAYFDDKGNIICQDEESEKFYNLEIGEAKFKEKLEGGFFNKTIYCYYKIPKTSFTLVCYEEISLQSNVSKELVFSLIFLSFLTMVVLIGIGTFISVYITTPIQKLVDSMSSVKEGWLRRVSLKHSDDEIGLLKDSYNEMLVETNRLIGQLLEKEKYIRRAEIDILQEQIKPHFLYNTIEMIASLSLDGSREEIYDSLETLGSFYRRFLSKGSNEVTLETELEIIRDYLKIQKLRYGDIFYDEYIVDERFMHIKLPKLILQPLVENSLYHGIRLKGEKGIIRISVFQKEEQVVIEVYDTGMGMTDAQIKKIFDDNVKHFGLKKTMERFQYFVGIKGSYRIESKEGEFTKIILSMDLL